jgi:hypothetical protein
MLPQLSFFTRIMDQVQRYTSFAYEQCAGQDRRVLRIYRLRKDPGQYYMISRRYSTYILARPTGPDPPPYKTYAATAIGLKYSQLISSLHAGHYGSMKIHGHALP